MYAHVKHTEMTQAQQGARTQINYLLVSYTSLGLCARGWLLQRMRRLNNMLIYVS